MREADRRRWEALRADRQLIDRAAAALRHAAWHQSYAGLADKHVAFGLAAILDELALHLPELGPTVRWQIVSSCRTLLGEPA